MAQSLTKSASELSDIVYEVVFKKTESESFGVTSVETLLQDLRYSENPINGDLEAKTHGYKNLEDFITSGVMSGRLQIEFDDNDNSGGMPSLIRAIPNADNISSYLDKIKRRYDNLHHDGHSVPSRRQQTLAEGDAMHLPSPGGLHQVVKQPNGRAVALRITTSKEELASKTYHVLFDVTGVAAGYAILDELRRDMKGSLIWLDAEKEAQRHGYDNFETFLASDAMAGRVKITYNDDGQLSFIQVIPKGEGLSHYLAMTNSRLEKEHFEGSSLNQSSLTMLVFCAVSTPPLIRPW
ncbi:hypothetical protein AAVH_25361 [Aphelenchoides avenae]|nr:hypothetical protein AAVH_25361 [Aphelenchus avenae]